MDSKRKSAAAINFDTFPPDVIEAARNESAKVQAILREACEAPRTVVATAESIAANAKIMKALHAGAARNLLGRIKRKELITKEELILRLGGGHRWVENALRDGRLFSLAAPSGVEYFPAFFADASYSRRTLSRIAQVLNGLPAASKYGFFITKFSSLQMTPLEGLALRRSRKVIACAIGFTRN